MYHALMARENQTVVRSVTIFGVRLFFSFALIDDLGVGQSAGNSFKWRNEVST